MDGKPLLRLGDAALSLFDKINPDVVAQRFIDQSAAQAWRDEFMRLRGSRELTPNQACRLLFGPYYRPDRTTYAFNANVEFAVEPKNLGLVFDDFDGTEAHWPSLADLMQRFNSSEGDLDAPGGPKTATSASKTPPCQRSCRLRRVAA
jgi:hypothetical protein